MGPELRQQIIRPAHPLVVWKADPRRNVLLFTPDPRESLEGKQRLQTMPSPSSSSNSSSLPRIRYVGTLYAPRPYLAGQSALLQLLPATKRSPLHPELVDVSTLTCTLTHARTHARTHVSMRVHSRVHNRTSVQVPPPTRWPRPAPRLCAPLEHAQAHVPSCTISNFTYRHWAQVGNDVQLLAYWAMHSLIR